MFSVSHGKVVAALVRKQDYFAVIARKCLGLLSSATNKTQTRVDISRKMNDQNEDSAGIKQFNQRFLDSAASGDMNALTSLMGAVDVDVKSARGWTALMFAARNGRASVISYLIEKNCDISAMNGSGQTALDIAHFWNHTEAAEVLSKHRKDVAFEQVHNYYSLNPLYRASDMRKDKDALLKAQMNDSTKFVVFSNRLPFLIKEGTPKAKFKFATFSRSQMPDSCFETKAANVFLGLETWDPNSSAWFAVDIGEEDIPSLKEHYPNGEFMPPFPVTMQMDPTHAGIFAEAHSILCWLDRYRFCPTCGTRNEVVEGGYKQVCTDKECSSHKGVHNTCYPRVDPSLIMLVVSPDQKRCLLGRGKRHPPKMYSCLAGFMEPGECIEDTCRREVEEESGVKIGRVDYHSSQPWPFPATLMLGCVAHARTDNIIIDKEELEDARWFPRAEVAQMLARQHPDGIFIPPAEAIAHQLVKSWISANASNL